MGAQRRPTHVLVLLAGVLFAQPACALSQDAPGASQDAAPAQADPPLKILGRSSHGHPIMEFHVRGERYEMEISATASRRERGLGGRAQFLPRTGMIFVHPSDKMRSYWMKDCMFDIDLIYLDKSGTVVAVHEMKREPPRQPGENTRRYTDRLRKHMSDKPARYALEFPPGTIKRLEFKTGEVIALPHRRLREMAR